MVKFLNFITTQLWIVISLLGIVVSVATGSLAPLTIAPWVGLFVGVAVNELTPMRQDTGIEIV